MLGNSGLSFPLGVLLFEACIMLDLLGLGWRTDGVVAWFREFMESWDLLYKQVSGRVFFLFG